MRNIFILILFALFTVPAYIFSQFGTVQENSMNSNLLRKPVSYSIYQPDPAAFHAPFRVLILLHGLDGNHKSFFDKGLKAQLDSLHKNRQIEPVIVVSPQGFNSYFMNSHDGRMPWEDMFIQELLPHLKQHFPVNESQIYLGGYSMGGYGAINLLLKYPDKFQGCMAVSAAIRTDSDLKDMSIKDYMTKYGNVFGPHHDSKKRLTDHWKANNFFYQMNDADIGQLQDKTWYISCGDDDALSHGNALLHARFKENQINHEFRIKDGAHSWDYFFESFEEGCTALLER